MVRVVKGIENKIPIEVVSLIDYTGFSAELEVNNITKSVSNLAARNPFIIFSVDEISSISPSASGRFIVYNKKGEIHIVYRIYFTTVDNSDEIQQFKSIRIVIAGSFRYDGMNSGSDEDIAKKVVEVVDSIIDGKVEESISGIIDPKVEAAVDAIIDTKVETVVNEIFDSSESDTVGGVISGLQEKIETVEDTLEKKVSLEYDNSDDNVKFFSGM